VRARATAIAVAVSLAIVAVALWWFVRDHWGGVYDDTFIYLRYVKNLDAGCGLRFNCGDAPVEGFTSPAYLGLLWLAGRLTSQLIDVSQIVCTASLAIALALAVWAAVVAGRGREPSWLPAVLAVSVALALALDHFVLLNAITGMETALGAAAVTALALAALAGRRWLVIAAAGAALLVRPECAVFVAALPILPGLRKPRYLVAAAGIVVAICVARYAVFGALAPNTYYAKAGGTWRHAELALTTSPLRSPTSARVGRTARAARAGRPGAPRLRVPPRRQRRLDRVFLRSGGDLSSTAG